MKILDAIILLLLITALGMGAYLLVLNLPGETRIYSTNLSEQIPELALANVSGNVVQFYPNMRYRDKSISYGLASACTEGKLANIERAFEILSEKTILDFYPAKNNPEINVLCSDIAPKAEEKGHFVAGEGGPSEIINTSYFAVILSGKISLYREEKCNEPKIALHEILHSLGFDHYNNIESILYPVTGCEQQIDEEIIDKINTIYSVDSLPDLTIESLEANRTGRYLNFDIRISNAGLADSKGAELEIYAENEKVTNFTIGDLEIGTKKLLFVQNVRLPSGSERIRFIVKSEDAEELSLENNQADIYSV